MDAAQLASQIMIDGAALLGLWRSTLRERQANRETRKIVVALANHLGLKVSTGVHFDPKTPFAGNPTIQGDSMRRIIPLIALAIVICAVAVGVAHADNGDNAKAVTDATAAGISAAAAASGGGALAMLVGFLSGAVPGLFAVLIHQASTKWHIGQRDNHIATLNAQLAQKAA
jgi:hypothetical protein